MVPSEVEAEKSKVYSKNKIPPRGAQTGRIVFCRNEDRSLGGQVEVSRDQVWRRRQQAVQSYGFPSLLSAFRGADLAKPTLLLAGCGHTVGWLSLTPCRLRGTDGWSATVNLVSATESCATATGGTPKACSHLASCSCASAAARCAARGHARRPVGLVMGY